jgi:hypothetical protein
MDIQYTNYPSKPSPKVTGFELIRLAELALGHMEKNVVEFVINCAYQQFDEVYEGKSSASYKASE